MPYFCARLLVVVVVDAPRPRKRNTCDYPFVLIQAKNHEEAFTRALELGRQQEHSYKNSRGQTVRWAFVRVEEVKRLPRKLDGQEVGSLLDVYLSDKPLTIKKRFSPERHEPLFT